MKKQLNLLIICLLGTLASYSQDCSECNESPLNIYFQPMIFEEIPTETVNLNFTVELLNSNDTINIDTIVYKINGVNSWQILDNDLISGNYVSEGNETKTLSISHNETEHPFALQEIQMFVTVNEKPLRVSAYLFYSPWGTLEIMNESNVNSDFKQWVVTNNSANHTRLEIDPDTLPEEPDTTLPMCWKSFEGLAYAIAVNCDTTSEDTIPLENQPEWPVKTFRGKAIGRLLYPYVNDNGVTVTIPIANAKIDVYSNGVRATTSTDANGNFSVDWKRTMINTSGNVPVRVDIKAANTLVQVARNPRNVFTWHGGVSHTLTHNHHGGSRTNDNFGDLILPQNTYLHIMHWTTRSVQFAQSELSGWSIPWYYLSVAIPSNLIQGGPCDFSLSKQEIRLYRPQCVGGESVTHHEVGHYVQFAIQNHKRQPNAGGLHTLVHNNTHPNQTITEGFANAFAMMVDAYYHSMDNESFRYNGISAHNRRFLFSNTHPFTNETTFALGMFDLWDGKNKLQSLGVNLSNINDERSVIDWDFGNSVAIDNIELTTKDVCLPFYTHRASDATTIQDVLQYYNSLISVSSCVNQSEIKKVADFNLSNLAYPNVNQPAGPLFRVNTDILSQNIGVINHRNDGLAIVGGFPVSQNPTNYGYNYNSIIDIDGELNTGTGSFNNALNLGLGSNDISDDLTLRNNANLFFNRNVPIGWVNNNSTVRPPANSKLISDICGATITVESGSNITVGDATINTTAEITADGRARIVLENGATLRVNDNSKFIIEREASLRFEDGATIILDGPNAVLEINGILEIADNAVFTFQGDGYLKTGFRRCLNCDNINAGVNSSIVLQGNGKSDKILEVSSNTNFEAGFDTKDFIINNGLVELGANSIIHVRRAVVDFQHSTFTAKNTSQKFGEIMLNGNGNHVFNDLEISYAKRGINDRQIYWGSKLSLIDVHFSHCNTGLLTNGRGAIMSNCTFSDNTVVGWEQISAAAGHNSRIKDCSFNDNKEGIIFNSAGGNLHVEQCDFANNLGGINFNGSGTLSGKCSSIIDGTVGVFTDHLSIIDFDRYSRMTIKNNVFNLAPTQARGLYLDNGRNDLELGTTYAGSLIAFGDVQYLSPINSTQTIPANSNHWKANGTSPINGTDYVLDASWINGSGGTNYLSGGIQLNDPTPIAPNPFICDEVVLDPCSNFPCLVSNPINTCPTCPVINTPNFTDVASNEAVKQILTILGQEDPDYIDAIEKFHEILTIPMVSTPDINYVNVYAYNEMKKTFTKALDAGLITISDEEVDASTQNLLDVIIHRSDADVNNDTTYYNERVYHEIDEILLYRSLSKYDMALSKLDALAAFAKGNDLVYVEELLCKFSAEHQLINNEITEHEFDSMMNICSVIKHNIDKVYDYEFQQQSEEEQDAFEANAYPNPSADGQINLLAENVTGSTMDVVVYNTSQQVLFSDTYPINEGTFQTQIDLSEVPTGAVYVHLITQDNTVVKLVILQ